MFDFKKLRRQGAHAPQKVARKSCRRLLLVALICLAGAAGCNRSNAKVVDVTGVVRRAGKPVPNLTLNFLPDTGRPSWGLTDNDGVYSLHYTAKQSGALLGRHRVSVSFRGDAGPQAELAVFKGRKPAYYAEQKAILDKYNGDKSPLEATIERAGQRVDFNLD